MRYIPHFRWYVINPASCIISILLAFSSQAQESRSSDNKSVMISKALDASTNKQVTIDTHTEMLPKERNQNRLIKEKSPYLLQHADNPVDWFPWGEEAFQRAKQDDKPIFLSIGYSTCHWCHVMEHESFESPEIAEIINRYFVPIKVDREERPDIDNIYMSAVTAMTGSGGWPLTVILTPDKRPFFGGTYFPPEAKWGSPGIVDVMESVHQSWLTNRQKILDSSISMTELLQKRMPMGVQGSELNKNVFNASFLQYSQMYDSRYGGFGQAPKFPTSHNLSFLLRYWKKTLDPKALEMVEETLTQMANGGMYDHLGGGFHRYATDQKWQIPHFEKMLYDQAILARTYLEAYQITKNDFYAQTAREIFEYVLRDMQHTQGGFYSAEDADSLDPDQYSQASLSAGHSAEKKEGAFYLWRYDEVRNHLDGNDAEIFCYHFGINIEGNAHQDPHGEFIGKNIIFVQKSIHETANHFKKTDLEISASLKRSKEALYTIRKDRPHPHLDDKVLVDWNGLMIASLSFGSRVLNEPRYQKAAETAAQFILENLVDQDRLLHRYRDQESGIMGTVEDYAFFVFGLLDLYEATFEVKYLQSAISFSESMMEHFEDDEIGGFFFTADDAEKILFRQKEIYDGAIPSGNSIAAHNLVKLYRITGDKKWQQSYEKLFNAFTQDISSRPSAYAQMLIAFDSAIGPSQEIVIAQGKSEKNDIKALVSKIYEYFLPNKVVLLNSNDEMAKISSFLKNQKSIDNKTTVYVCENHVCKLPVHGVEKLGDILNRLTQQK